MRRGVLRLSWCRTCCRPRPRPGGPSSSGRRSWCRSPRRCPPGGCRAHGSGRHGRRHRGQVSREIASAVCASTKGYRHPTTHLVCSRNPNRSPRATRLTNSPCLVRRTGPEFRGSSLEILTTLESAASLTQGWPTGTFRKNHRSTAMTQDSLDYSRTYIAFASCGPALRACCSKFGALNVCVPCMRLP